MLPMFKSARIGIQVTSANVPHLGLRISQGREGAVTASAAPRAAPSRS